MGDYVKRKRQLPQEHMVVEKHVQEQQVIDLEKLANSVARIIIANLPKNIGQTTIIQDRTSGQTDKKDDFNPSASLERLAESMIVQRGKKASNFDDLGKTRETEIDQDETDKTIDLLKGLED